ncbi:hypothetical protein NDU88_004045 [Pleurodeles waltl]|uniref:Uncharacterized protein n=1 Tax=Pleurodeles waltl TaxID=8319 RepID=A0AAV7VHP4_PLEWA|nr:hypothetical protein NDU88_004045 [Pleurodeles waltl]
MQLRAARRGFCALPERGEWRVLSGGGPLAVVSGRGPPQAKSAQPRALDARPGGGGVLPGPRRTSPPRLRQCGWRLRLWRRPAGRFEAPWGRDE